MPTIQALLENNRAWAQAVSAEDPSFFQRLSAQQSPGYLWIGCADSRVPSTQLTGLLPGEMFVHRNVANVVVHADLNCLSVIQYAVEVLKVEHIIVCGHYGCGGIERALSEERSAMVDHWLQPITMFHRKHRAHFNRLSSRTALLDRVSELNIEMQVRRIATMPLVENAWSRGQDLHLHGWIYGMHDGLIRDLGPHVSSIEERDALPSIDQRVFHAEEPSSGLRRHALEAFSSLKLTDDLASPSCCMPDEH
jgi:carbonic anhydrase